jgi:transposase
MRIRKVSVNPDEIKSPVPYDHYVALDWSLAMMAIGHASAGAHAPKVFERPSDLRELKEYLGTLKGRTILVLEESSGAHWLYLELLDHVEKVVVCDPFHNRLLCHGPKTDKIDAGKLCGLLRAGLLKEVFHSDSTLYELRQLVSAYQDIVCAGVRFQNQKASLRIGHRDKGTSAEFIEEVLDRNIEQYRENKREYEKRFEGVARHNRLVRHQKELPGIGTIGAVRIVACVVDARRFPHVGNYFSYCGLVRHEKLSGGRSYGRRKPRYSRVLKSVYKTAVLAALRGENPMREYYDYLLSKGVAAHNARHAVARHIARISYGMLKSGMRYEPYRWRQNAKSVA